MGYQLQILAVALLLTGCQHTGGATTISMTCQTGERRHGACKANFGVMENQYRLELEHPNFKYYRTKIKVSARLTAAKGTVRVWLDSDGDGPVEAILRPGQPVELTGIAHVSSLTDKNTLNLHFQVIDPATNGRAENIEAEIEYLM